MMVSCICTDYIRICANVYLKDILPKVNFKDQSSDNIEMRLRDCMIKQVNFSY